MTPSAKILVADDEANMRLTLKKMLVRDGYQVVTAESGQAALELIAGQTFDLALIDLKLGDVEGTEVLAALHQQSPDTIVIMLTAHASLESAVEALRQGAYDYLFKPCSTVKLRESIRQGLLKHRQQQQQRKLLHQLEQFVATNLENLRTFSAGQVDRPSSAAAVESAVEPILSAMEQPAEEPERFLQKEGLIVDFLRHVITLDGHLLELSPTEFDLVAYLVSEAPRVISPQELVREVQGYESEQYEASEIMRFHIYRLRRKIKKAAGRTNIIHTVRGVGYTIGSE